jgi:hypothetical protein
MRGCTIAVALPKRMQTIRSLVQFEPMNLGKFCDQ